MPISRAISCLTAGFLALAGLPALAQGRQDTILVLDGSGSMWGQIDGVAKIAIAQQVVGELLDRLPAAQNLGLTVYGHRSQGDCADIETLVPPGPDSRAAIRAAVEAIRPRGKTPMTDAVIAAAEALHYREAAATVILVSDGIETCNPDPCAAARVLEETGTDFTAHVVGFGVGSDVAALAQMRCIAEETGGRFLTAEDARALAEALGEFSAPPPAAAEPAQPRPVPVEFSAHIGSETGPAIGAGLVWTVIGPAGVVIENDGADASPTLRLPPRDYRALVRRLADGAYAEASFHPGAAPMSLRLVLPELLAQAVISGPGEAPIGATIRLDWQADTDTDGGDFLAVAAPDAEAGDYLGYRSVADGSPAELVLPLIPGHYELRYVASISGGRTVLARAPIRVTDLLVTLAAESRAAAGGTFTVGFVGPGYANDYISVARPDEPDGSYASYAYTRTGNPTGLTLPLDPGDYELRYVANGSPDRVLARQPLNVTEISARLDAPDSAAAGSFVKVAWNGPDNANDYIAVAATEAGPDQYESYDFTRNGNPVSVRMPLDPGSYELRYIANGVSDKIIARRAITVYEVAATLDASDRAAAGSFVKVGWRGPDHQNDFISVARPDVEPGQYDGYEFTRNGTPAAVRMPLEPGRYELRYVAEGTPDKVLARRAITVTEIGATLAAPDSAPAGSLLKLGWSGPDNQNDYLAIARPDAEAGQYEHYAYSRNGSPASLTLPIRPGDYELRYVANGTPDRILARRPLRVTDVSASLEAPATAVAGSEVTIAWTGPDNRNDFISVALPEAEVGNYENYGYTRNGSPARVEMPLAPGIYQLRYVAQGNPDRILTQRPIEVVAAKVTLTAPGAAVAGETLNVSWEGPDNRNDFIAVALPGSEPNDHVNYSYSRNGSPLKLLMPVEAGSYEIRYIGQGRPDQVLAFVPITLSPVTASLTAPERARAGEKLMVGWQGPDYANDRIVIALPGEPDELTHAYTRNGQPLAVPLPATAGSYEIRYVLGQGKVVIATRPLLVD